MRPIRILFAEVPQLTRALLGEIFADAHDLEIVDPADVTEDSPGGRVDVVITETGSASVPSPLQSAVFRESPRNVLAVTIRGKRVMLFEIRQRSPISYDPSPDALIAAIRLAVAPWRSAEE